MRTNIVIDDNLMAEAIELSQLKTKKAVVETGLRLLIRIKKQERIKSLRGKLKWDGDLGACIDLNVKPHSFSGQVQRLVIRFSVSIIYLKLNGNGEINTNNIQI